MGECRMGVGLLGRLNLAILQHTTTGVSGYHALALQQIGVNREHRND